MFYDRRVPHHDRDRIIAAHLQGAASRHAGWRRPEGPDREAAIMELREIATAAPAPLRGSPHQPVPELRADLLAEVAGIFLGTAPALHPEHHEIAADLLIEAGADTARLEHWAAVGRKRATAGQPRPAGTAAARWP